MPAPRGGRPSPPRSPAPGAASLRPEAPAAILLAGKFPTQRTMTTKRSPQAFAWAHGGGGRPVADMDRPCRDGADRAERRYRRLTSSFSWRPSSSSPSCHPPPVPRVPRLMTSAGILGEGPETCQEENTTCSVATASEGLHLGAQP